MEVGAIIYKAVGVVVVAAAAAVTVVRVAIANVVAIIEPSRVIFFLDQNWTLS